MLRQVDMGSVCNIESAGNHSNTIDTNRRLGGILRRRMTPWPRAKTAEWMPPSGNLNRVGNLSRTRNAMVVPQSRIYTPLDKRSARRNIVSGASF